MKVPAALYLLLLLVAAAVGFDGTMRVYDRVHPSPAPAPTPGPSVDFAGLAKQVKSREHTAESAAYLDAETRISRGDPLSAVMPDLTKAVSAGRKTAYRPVQVGLSQIVPDGQEPGGSTDRAELAKAFGDYGRGLGSAK